MKILKTQLNLADTFYECDHQYKHGRIFLLPIKQPVVFVVCRKAYSNDFPKWALAVALEISRNQSTLVNQHFKHLKNIV
jgi:hypothetical protein